MPCRCSLDSADKHWADPTRPQARPSLLCAPLVLCSWRSCWFLALGVMLSFLGLPQQTPAAWARRLLTAVLSHLCKHQEQCCNSLSWHLVGSCSQVEAFKGHEAFWECGLPGSAHVAETSLSSGGNQGQGCREPNYQQQQVLLRPESPGPVRGMGLRDIRSLMPCSQSRTRSQRSGRLCRASPPTPPRPQSGHPTGLRQKAGGKGSSSWPRLHPRGVREGGAVGGGGPAGPRRSGHFGLQVSLVGFRGKQ